MKHAELRNAKLSLKKFNTSSYHKMKRISSFLLTSEFRFRNWNYRYLNYFRLRWWKSDTSAFPYRWGRRQSFPSRRDRTRSANGLLILHSSCLTLH